VEDVFWEGNLDRTIRPHGYPMWQQLISANMSGMNSDDAGPADVALRSLTDGVVTIRPPARGDAERLIAGRDEEWRRWLGPGSDEPSPTACIVVSGQVVGWVDYDTGRESLQAGEVNVGYNVFASHRRNGYAVRAVELLIRFLDQSTAFHTATLLIDPGNEASLAVAERCGFIPDSDIDGSRCFKRPTHHERDR
jgi:RimJ/RimL family protein N-acetyltransferase